MTKFILAWITVSRWQQVEDGDWMVGLVCCAWFSIMLLSGWGREAYSTLPFSIIDDWSGRSVW